MKYKAIKNRIVIYLARLLRKTKICYPMKLSLEPTNHCNLHCPLCPTGANKLKFSKGFMQWDLFTNIVDQLHPFLLQARLVGFGEPFLHPQITDMIEYMSSKNIKVIVSTNGMFINDINIIDKLSKSRLYKLIISLDGASEGTYLKYRKGGNFSDVISAIKKIEEFKKKNKLIFPKIVIQFIVMKHNEHEIPLIKSISKELGVKVNFKPVVVKENIENYMPKESRFSRYKNKNGVLIAKKREPKTCEFLWDTLTVNWDGTVVSCCKDPFRVNSIGIIDSQTNILDFWHSNNYISLRKQLLSNKNSLIKCRNCVRYKENYITRHIL